MHFSNLIYWDLSAVVEENSKLVNFLCVLQSMMFTLQIVGGISIINVKLIES